MSGPLHFKGCEKQSKGRRWVQQGLYVVESIHQGYDLSRLLLIILLEAPSREFHTSCPMEMLYAKYLMISAVSIEELLVKLKTWKSEIETQGLRLNMER